MNGKRGIGVLILFVLCSAVNAQLTMQKHDEGILIVDGKKKILFYQTEPKSYEGKYARCNYIHPLWGADGSILTEDFPADHLHHRGVFWAWHQVWIGDKKISDSWELKDFEQEVVEFEFFKLSYDEVQLKTEVDWKSELWKKAGEKVPYLKEHTTITVHPQKGNYRKIDFEISLLALEEGVRIGGSDDKKGYSGFAVRMALPEDITFSGSEGMVEPEETAIKSAGFINMAGKVGNKNSKGGIVIIDDSENPGYPQSWLLRAKNSMQNAVWPGRATVPVSTEQPLLLKYSLVVYSGKMNAAKIEKIIQK